MIYSLKHMATQRRLNNWGTLLEEKKEEEFLSRESTASILPGYSLLNLFR